MCCTLFPYRVLSHWVFPKGFNEATCKHTMNSGLGLLKPTTSCLVYFNFYLFIWLRLWAFVSALFSASMFSRPFYFKTQKGKLLYNSLWLAIFASCLLWNNFAFANSETLSLFPVRNRESSRVLSSSKPPSLWRFYTPSHPTICLERDTHPARQIP